MEGTESRSRANVVVGGLVHGVFFRDFVRERAVSLGVTGWVRNTPDGKVEAVFEGKAHAVSEMVESCRQGPPRASVEKFDVRMEDYKGEFAAFSVRR